MFAKEISDHKGQIFPSKVEMCKYYNITIASFDSRINRGWDLETALTKPKGYRPNAKTYIDHEGNVFDTLIDMANYWNIPDSTLQRRLAVMKLDIKDALTLPTENIKQAQHKCYDHLGNEYPSKAAMCEAYNIDRQIYFGRIGIGWSVEKALTTPIDFQPANAKSITDHTGKTYKSISSLCKAWNMTRSTYNARIKSGWTIEQALTTPQKQIRINKQSCFDHKGIEYESLNAMCNQYGIARHTYSTRVDKLGWTIEKALTTPNIISGTKCIDFMGREFPTKNDMAHYYGLPNYLLQGKSSAKANIQNIIENKFINNNMITTVTVKELIKFPYFLVTKNNKDYVLHIDTILDLYHNDNFYPIPETKLQDKNLIIDSCIKFPYYNVTYNNVKLIWSYWQIINYRKTTNFGLSCQKIT